jgi:hypothetical protein
MGEERPLYILVREVPPEISKIAMRPVMDRQTGQIVQITNLASPPLVPYFGSNESTSTEVEVGETIVLWLRRIVKSKRSNWQNVIFPKASQVWERNILAQICPLIATSNKEHKHLEIAMELTFYTHIKIHSFEIPSDQVNNIYSRLQDSDFNSRRPGPGERVCPRAVNTFLSMLIMPNFRLQAEALLKHLSSLFADRNSTVEIGIIAFCESFLFLVALAQLQISVLQTGMLLHNYEDRYTVDEAKQEIKKMEDELARIIIELCVFKFRKVAKRMILEGSMVAGEVNMLDEEPLSRFFDRLHKITELCGKLSSRSSDGQILTTRAGGSSAWQTELGIIDEQTFHVTNTRRLLQKLYRAVLQVLPPAKACNLELDLRDECGIAEGWESS